MPKIKDASINILSKFIKSDPPPVKQQIETKFNKDLLSPEDYVFLKSLIKFGGLECHGLMKTSSYLLFLIDDDWSSIAFPLNKIKPQFEKIKMYTKIEKEQLQIKE